MQHCETKTPHIILQRGVATKDLSTAVSSTQMIIMILYRKAAVRID